jgi:hypothetical protein
MNNACCPQDAGCMHTGCTGPCMDSCGGNPSCCPPDSGFDGGSCGTPGSGCTSTGQCCSGLMCATVGGAGQCEPNCNPPGTPCGGSALCCYPHTCSAVPAPPPASSGASSGGPLPDAGLPGMCQ